MSRDEFIAHVAAIAGYLYDALDAPREAVHDRSTPDNLSSSKEDIKRAKAAERSRNYRARKAACRHAESVTERDGSVMQSVTERDAKRDGSRDHASQKLSVSGENSAELGSFQKSVNSELRTRASVTERDGQSVTRDAVLLPASTPSLRVLRHLVEAGLPHFDHHSWRPDLERLATRPEAQLKTVLANALSDPWVRAKRSRASPGHLAKHFERYLDAEPKPKRGGGLAPVSTPEEYAAWAGRDPIAEGVFG